jgi:uncharacterized protein (TIGR03437 family)
LKFKILPGFLLCLAAVPASATVTLGLSNQDFILTGIGPNAQGAGQATVSWGSCAFDGTNTTCTLSGPYTGLGPGGTYAFVISYAGNGAFPLIAVFPSGSNQFSFQAKSNYRSFVINLTPASGPVISFYSFANWNWQYSAPMCTPVAAPCNAGQVAATPGAIITGPVVGAFDPTPSITPSGALTPDNYGSFASVAPASWMVMYGVNLVTNTLSETWTTAFNGNQAPTSLSGTTVTVAGAPAFVAYVSPGQVNVQVPSGIPSGPQPIVVTTPGGSSIPYTINVNATEPGLLAPLSFVIGGKQNVVALFSNTLTYVLPVAVSGIATARAKPGDSITLYGIGFGPVTPNIVAGQIVQQVNQVQADFAITFANVSATVTYAGLVPEIVGLFQFNVVVPNIAASDAVPVAFTLGGVSGTQNLVIAIQN